METISRGFNAIGTAVTQSVYKKEIFLAKSCRF